MSAQDGSGLLRTREPRGDSGQGTVAVRTQGSRVGTAPRASSAPQSPRQVLLLPGELAGLAGCREAAVGGPEVRTAGCREAGEALPE